MYYSILICLSFAALSALISAIVTTNMNEKHCINCEAKYGINKPESRLRSNVNEIYLS
jgi:hypothetical protein